ncbi:MAG: hypothetical protein AB7O26_04875 [Planctomycetaceae bacterium]
MKQRAIDSVSTLSRFLGLCGAASLLMTLTGCSFTFPLARQQQFGPALPADAPKAEIVGRVNENISRVSSWRSDNVRISSRTPMMRIKIDAKIAVESPKNFRLMANSIRGDEADFGCNDELFWFWSRDSEPRCVFHARHDQVADSEQLRQLPFQPDWLMEVLGVVPLNEEELTLHVESSSRHEASLISERLLPSGKAVKRVILVDTQYGRVLQHSLYDDSGRLIAKAKLSRHDRDPVSGAILPRMIDIEWPQANNLSMTMEIGKLTVNPASVPAQMFALPRKPGYAALDLGAGAPRIAMPQGDRFNAPSPHQRTPRNTAQSREDEFVTPVTGEREEPASGRVRFDNLSDEPAAAPATNGDELDAAGETGGADDDLPDWAKEPIRMSPREKPAMRRL